MRGIVRCEVLHALAEVWKQECEYYNINLLGRPLTEILPIRGKHVAHDGKAACPSWASVVPIYGHITICVQVYSFIIEIRVEKCSAALKVRVEKCGIVAKVRVEKCIFALFLCYKSILNYQRNLKKTMRYGKIISMSPYREQDWMKNIPLYAVEESFWLMSLERILKWSSLSGLHNN